MLQKTRSGISVFRKLYSECKDKALKCKFITKTVLFCYWAKEHLIQSTKFRTSEGLRLHSGEHHAQGKLIADFFMKS